MLMEILKQPQYQPVPVERQIMLIFAAINKYLADIEIEDIKQFEKEFYEFMSTQYPHVERAIKDAGEIEEDTEKQLREGIELFRESFIKSNGRGETADEAGSETK